MIGNQHAHVRLGQRADNGLAPRKASLVQGAAAPLLSAVSLIALCGVLLVRPALAQEQTRLSPTQAALEPWNRPLGGSPGIASWGGPDATLQPGLHWDATNAPQVSPMIGPQPWDRRESGTSAEESRAWRLMPDGVIYSSYLAGVKEPRLAAVFNHDDRWGSMVDLEAGGRVGLLRYGAEEGAPRPSGWELDLEGAAFPRLDLDHNEDLVAADFRAGVPLTFGAGPFQAKLAVYHLSSHLGDEFQLRYPGCPRINYSRNAIVLGGSYYLTDDLRLYGEAEWAFYTDGGARPWAFQFGLEYSPLQSARAAGGSPFVAFNGHLREELDFGGNFVAQAGWQWRGGSNHLTRIGIQYYTGKSEQFQFLQRDEEKIGLAIWYDY